MPVPSRTSTPRLRSCRTSGRAIGAPDETTACRQRVEAMGWEVLCLLQLAGARRSAHLRAVSKIDVERLLGVPQPLHEPLARERSPADRGGQKGCLTRPPHHDRLTALPDVVHGAVPEPVQRIAAGVAEWLKHHDQPEPARCRGPRRPRRPRGLYGGCRCGAQGGTLRRTPGSLSGQPALNRTPACSYRSEIVSMIDAP